MPAAAPRISINITIPTDYCKYTVQSNEVVVMREKREKITGKKSCKWTRGCVIFWAHGKMKKTHYKQTEGKLSIALCIRRKVKYTKIFLCIFKWKRGSFPTFSYINIVFVPYLDSALNMDTPNIIKTTIIIIKNIDTWRYMSVKKTSWKDNLAWKVQKSTRFAILKETSVFVVWWS